MIFYHVQPPLTFAVTRAHKKKVESPLSYITYEFPYCIHVHCSMEAYM